MIALSSLEIATNILDRMDQNYLWTSRQFGRLATNIAIAQFNSITFTDALIQALAEGIETHPEVKEFAARTPTHYDLLNKVLDEVYTYNQLQPSTPSAA